MKQKHVFKDKKINKAYQDAKKRLTKEIMKEIKRLKKDAAFMAKLDKEIEDNKHNITKYIERAFIKSKKETGWTKPI